MIQLIDDSNFIQEEDLIKKHLIKHEEINKNIEDYISGKIPQGYSTISEKLNKHYLFKKNEFYLCTGKKGDGKTTINQCLQLLGAIKNDLIFVVAFQENSEWSMKLNYMNYLCGEFAKTFKQKKPKEFQIISDWIDKHFYFIEVESVKEACDFTEKLIKQGVDVHALFLDPINSFMNGWQDTGNAYADGKILGIKILNFSKKWCSVHVSQHPTMTAQRSKEDVTSYDGEGGWLLNKASFTYCINRKEGNQNELTVDNVRNKHTGGDTTLKDNPIVIYWFPNKIDIDFRQGYAKDEDCIQKSIKESKIFDFEITKETTILQTMTPDLAFGDDEEVPF